MSERRHTLGIDWLSEIRPKSVEQRLQAMKLPQMDVSHAEHLEFFAGAPFVRGDQRPRFLDRFSLIDDSSILVNRHVSIHSRQTTVDSRYLLEERSGPFASHSALRARERYPIV